VTDKELTVAQLVMKFLAIYDYSLWIIFTRCTQIMFRTIFFLEVSTDMKRKILKTLRSVPTVSEELTVHDE